MDIKLDPGLVRLLTIKEACQRLSCSRSTLYCLAARGDLTILKLAGASRMRSDQLTTYISSLPATKPTLPTADQ